MTSIRTPLDFHGTLRLEATVSQTMTGWKRWVLKPVDPFFSKEGSGTLLRIQVVGSSKEPKFGRERGDQSPENKGHRESRALAAGGLHNGGDRIDATVQVHDPLDVQLQPADVLDQVHGERRR